MSDSLRGPRPDSAGAADDAALSRRLRHRRIQGLFLQARVLTGAPRTEFVNDACGDDAELRAELELLLTHDREPLPFLEEALEDTGNKDRLRAEVSALLAQGGSSAGAPAEEQASPRVIGGFRILRKLGEGGMGAVYEAEQDHPPRTVALKVLRPLLLSPEGLRRFERESEYLGRLQHPGIAQVYQSGTFESADGPQPYFAMEFIRGESLTEHVRRKELDVRARLDLVARVADAVQHAHQHGVIHRDLKPQNILVDATGQPKVLDFGIARASDSDVKLTTQHTEVGQILGTLAYMSPEQAAGDSAEIDTRSDVYSLGMLLYELLAERLPYDVAQKSLPEALRTIQESEPRRLSTVHRVFRGDVETIVGTALEKDKERRYASAAALAADLRHYLRDQPIAARPPSRMYVLAKFARRNRLAVTASALIFVSLLVGLTVALRFGWLEAEQRRAAEARRDEVLRLSALQDLEDLVHQAEALWPAHPAIIERSREWIARARLLVAGLPAHVAQRSALRARALPRTEAQRMEQRARHPDSEELERLGGELVSLACSLAQRRDGVRAPLPEVRWDDLPADAASLIRLARTKVVPERERQGEETLGLALALRALENAGAEERALAGETLCWAYFALGRDDEALDAGFAALEASSAEQEPRFAATLARLEEEVAAVSSPDWAERAETRLASAEARRAELEPRVEARSEWHFAEDDSGARWWDTQLSKLIDGLEALAAGLLSELPDAVTTNYGWPVPRRLAFAEQLRSAHAAGGELAERWAAAADELRARYPGLELGPQLGLQPLGADPHSGLWEFAHLLSGRVPERAADGRLQLSDETCVVLVLLPGGTFAMGAQANDTSARNFDPGAQLQEGPVHDVTLGPFFLSKYELTQAQWQRFTGANPSYSEDGSPTSPRQPVDQVSWTAGMRILGQLGLTLPSEEQWEYAARGGTSTVWWTGNARESLQGAANLADLTAARGVRGALDFDPTFTLDDDFLWSAPVGTFAPNPFGLHEIHGNVTEWCLTPPGFYTPQGRLPPTGDSVGTRFFRIGRGGGFTSSAADARSAFRNNATPETADYRLGLRPARCIEE